MSAGVREQASMKHLLCGLLLTMVGIGGAHAQAGTAIKSYALPGGWEFGANFELSRTFNDNFFYEQDNERSVNGLLLRPALTVGKNYERVRAALNLGGEMARYDLPGDLADYFDGFVGLDLDYEGGVRDRFSLRASSRQGHDPFGTTRTTGVNNDVLDLTAELDEWTMDQVRGSYRYGAPEAVLNFELQAGHLVKDYTTNEASTEFLNYAKSSLSETLIYNYSPKTAFLLNLEQDFVRFDSIIARRDADEYRARVGARWNPLSKVSVDLKVGALRREFKDPTLDNFDGADWVATAIYTPASRSVITVQTGRESQESYVLGSTFIDNQMYAVEWVQRFGRRVRMVAGARWITSEFKEIAREDDVQAYRLMLSYRLLEFVDVFATANYVERDSTVSTLDFDQTSGMMLGFRVSP